MAAITRAFVTVEFHSLTMIEAIIIHSYINLATDARLIHHKMFSQHPSYPG